MLSRPVKGTNRRSPRQQEARRQRAELERSAKNRAENVMIVDLMRNDLSRVCAAGSVQVPRLLGVEPHPGLWHLVSDVHGTLSAAAGDGDLIRAAFPPGSVTGAPKVRALEIIHELEATPREIYTGAVGYRSPVAGLELNVAIRTFEFHAGRVWLGSGGGIVADSSADEEYRECLLKAGPLIRALGGRLARERGLPAAGARAGGASWPGRPCSRGPPPECSRRCWSPTGTPAACGPCRPAGGQRPAAVRQGPAGGLPGRPGGSAHRQPVRAAADHPAASRGCSVSSPRSCRWISPPRR